MPGERKPRVTLIVARARNGVIGKDNAMPWKIPGEQAYFKRVTTGHPIVMGRKTWESIGRPLPGRRSIVVTRDPGYFAPGAETVHSFEAALALTSDASEIFVIGGAQLYAAAMPRADRLLITEIDHDFDGDTLMPAPDAALWRETQRGSHPPAGDRRYGFAFVTYERR
jgi:dihydrofolate reductase